MKNCETKLIRIMYTKIRWIVLTLIIISYWYESIFIYLLEKRFPLETRNRFVVLASAGITATASATVQENTVLVSQRRRIDRESFPTLQRCDDGRKNKMCPRGNTPAVLSSSICENRVRRRGNQRRRRIRRTRGWCILIFFSNFPVTYYCHHYYCIYLPIVKWKV